MKSFVMACFLTLLLGCAIVPGPMGFPHLRWYWSDKAKDYRDQQKADKVREEEFKRTNVVEHLRK